MSGYGEEVANQTMMFLQKVSSMMFGDFVNSSKSLTKSIGVNKDNLTYLMARSKRGGAISLEHLNRYSEGYGTQTIEIESDYTDIFNKLALDLDLYYSKGKSEDNITKIYVSNKDFQKVKSLKTLIDVKLQRKKSLNKEDFRNYLYTKKSNEFYSIENLSEEELELLDFNQIDHDLIYTKIEPDCILIAEEDYDKFLQSYKEVKGLLEGKDKEEIKKSLQNKIMSRNIVRAIDKDEIKKYGRYLVVDAVSPDKFIDVQKLKLAIIREKGEISEEDLSSIQRNYSYMTAPVVFEVNEYSNFIKLDYEEQEKIIKNKANYYISKYNIKDEPYDKKSIKDENLLDDLTITSKSFKRKITKERFDEIINKNSKNNKSEKEVQKQEKTKEERLR